MTLNAYYWIKVVDLKAKFPESTANYKPNHWYIAKRIDLPNSWLMLDDSEVPLVFLDSEVLEVSKEIIPPPDEEIMRDWEELCQI